MPILSKGGFYMAKANSNISEKCIRNADCVTETRMGNSILIVYGFYTPNTTVTATEKMMRVLRSEIAEAQVVGQRH